MSACPLYKMDHIESHVARGRNVLINMAGDNAIEEDDSYKQSIFFCLLCGRCEAVCPAKISTVAITEKARSSFYSRKGLPLLERIVYRNLFSRRSVMANTLAFARLIPGFSSKKGMPLRHMADMANLFSAGVYIPKLSRPFLSERMGRRSESETGKVVKGTVGFFPGCSFEFFFADIGEKIVEALVEREYRVVYRPDLQCCGLAVNSGGDADTARSMAKQNIDKLLDFDYVVTGCATCGSTLKEYRDWFEEDDEWKQKARQLSGKVRDVSEFLAPVAVNASAETPDKPEKVTYHDPCHLRWRQGVFRQPREIIKAVKGVELIEMDAADACCGLGGSFGLRNREISLAMQKKKMDSIAKTGATTVVTSCPGCMIQLMDGARRYSLPIEVKHVSQYL